MYFLFFFIYISLLYTSFVNILLHTLYFISFIYDQGWQFLPDPNGLGLPGPIGNKVRYGLKKKKKPEASPGQVRVL